AADDHVDLDQRAPHPAGRVGRDTVGDDGDLGRDLGDGGRRRDRHGDPLAPRAVEAPRRLTASRPASPGRVRSTCVSSPVMRPSIHRILHSLAGCASAAAVAASVLSPIARAQGPGDQTLDAATRAVIDSTARSVLAATGVPSASVAVVKDGRVAYSQAYGT